MTWYLYKPQLGVDGPSGALVHSGVGQVYAPDDFDLTAPLTAYSLEGLPQSVIQVGGDGLVQAFLLEDQPEAIWASGEYRVPLDSITGMRAAVEQALTAVMNALLLVQSAADDAHDAAQSVALPSPNVDGNVLTAFEGQWVSLPSGGGGGGSGIIGAPAVWPTTFNPASHSHVIGDLLRAAGVPLSPAVVSFLQALDQGGARTAIGAGTGNGTSNLTVGTSPGQAMSATRTFNANEINLASAIPGVTGSTVQQALAEIMTIASSGGGGGSVTLPTGLLIVRRWVSPSGYPVRGVLPTGAIVEWEGPVPPTPGGAYSVVDVDRYLATA